MQREIHKICLSGITGVERIRAIDIISAALAAQYHRNILVLNEGYASDAAIEQIPNTVKVFMICNDSKQPFEVVASDDHKPDESEKIAAGMDKVLNGCVVIAE